MTTKFIDYTIEHGEDCSAIQITEQAHSAMPDVFITLDDGTTSTIGTCNTPEFYSDLGRVYLRGNAKEEDNRRNYIESNESIARFNTIMRILNNAYAEVQNSNTKIRGNYVEYGAGAGWRKLQDILSKFRLPASVTELRARSYNAKMRYLSSTRPNWFGGLYTSVLDDSEEEEEEYEEGETALYVPASTISVTDSIDLSRYQATATWRVSA